MGTAAGVFAGTAEEESACHRPSWARLLRKILEVDPLLRSQCQAEMKVISVIADPAVIDEILACIKERGRADPFEERGPPEGEVASVEGGA